MAKWLTIQEAAEYLKYSTQTIYNSIYRGKPLGLLFKKKGTPARRVKQSDLDKYLEGKL